MGVTFTPNMGFAKPDSADLAENWVNGPNYNDDNNQILLTNTPYVLTTYVPTLIGTTTPPSVGAGVLKGQYTDHLGLIRGQVKLQFIDPGVSVGLGDWGFKLPVPVDPSYHIVGTALADSGSNLVGQLSCIGEGYLHDASTPANCSTVAVDCVTIAGISYARLVTEAVAGKGSRLVGSTSPFVVATTDNISFNFFYKKQ